LSLLAFASSLPSVSTEVESRATIPTVSFDELVHVHHHATTH
jgi:hypothetical protein